MQLALFRHNAEPRPSDDLLQKLSAPGTRSEFRWERNGWALFVMCLQCERAKQTLPPPACHMVADHVTAAIVSRIDDTLLRRRYTTMRLHIKRHLHWHDISEQTALA